MSLDDKFTASGILISSGIGADPGYYSGRGATLSDLYPDRLEIIYQSVLQGHGKSAAHEFAELVRTMPKLSATDFIIAFLKLGSHGWKLEKEHLGGAKGVYIDNEGQANATLFNSFSGWASTDDTEAIRGPFMRRHPEEYQRKGKDEMGRPYIRDANGKPSYRSKDKVGK